MNAALRISLSSTILWLVFMFNPKVGLFGCSAARFRLFIRLFYEKQRAIFGHDHPNCGRFAVSSLAVFYGKFILAFHACALAFTRVGERALVIASLFLRRPEWPL